MRYFWITIVLISSLFSCSSEQTGKKAESTDENKVTVSQIEFNGSPEEIGQQIMDHFYAGMNAKDLEKTCQVLHSEVTYMDAVKGFDRVKKHLVKVFNNEPINWLTLKDMKIVKATEEKIVIYTLENDANGLGDNIGYYVMEKENGQFRLIEITIPNVEVDDYKNL